MPIFKKRKWIYRLFEWIVSLRYRVQVTGKEELTQKISKGHGILFLPNHTAMVDPIIACAKLFSQFRIRPVGIEYMYRHPLFKKAMRSFQAIPIPDFTSAVNEYKIQKLERIFEEIGEGLKRGENFILYPSGALKSSGEERIGGAFSVHTLLQKCPLANIALVRTTGLWGSSFSKALTNQSPSPELFVKSLKTLLKNGIFFSPRRKVTMEIVVNPPDFPRKSSRLELNRYLETWYNQYIDKQGNTLFKEPLSLVSYHMWSKPLVPAEMCRTKEGVESEEVVKEVAEEIRRIIKDRDLVINRNSHLSFDLRMDSLEMADLYAHLIKRYKIEGGEYRVFETVGDIADFIKKQTGAPSPKASYPFFCWPQESNRPKPILAQGETLPEAFLKVCKRMGPFAACGDDFSGVFTYKKMKRASFVLAQHFRKLPESTIGVMLPASVGTFIIIFALQLANKIPVMLNWTLGPRNLSQMLAISGAKRVLTSWKFIDKLSHVDFSPLIDHITFLEDIRSDISLISKLRGAFLSLLSPSIALRLGKVKKASQNAPCALLFTSGTEAAPKCVPLSHKNILSNIRSSLEAFGAILGEDATYGVLPPFHSFGFASTGMLALLSGLKIAFYADPTDSVALAEGIERWKISIFTSPPNFIRKILRAASLGQLKSVRIFASGGDKPSPEMVEEITKLGARFIEGYGITECSGAVTMTRPKEPHKGLGRLLSGYEACTVDPETAEPLLNGQEGEVCIRGPGVFEGYLGSSMNPFIYREGKPWYRTGDIGYLEEGGFFFLSGRLKRFTKLGGEMISLGAVEEALNTAFADHPQFSASAPSIAVYADESHETARLILVASFHMTKEEANRALKTAGFSNLIKISEVRRLEEIPLLGTGKINYHASKNLSTCLEA